MARLKQDFSELRQDYLEDHRALVRRVTALEQNLYQEESDRERMDTSLSDRLDRLEVEH